MGKYIDATELMIGDWVSLNGIPIKIQSINGPKGELTINHHIYWVEDIIPIPLTPEILKRNGFVLTEVGDNGIATPRNNINRYEKHECKTKWRDIIMWYDRITKKWCLHGINSIQLNYIHELQHALRLCGIKKEIEL